eukprot:3967975-Prorocentrum_lima.AAC.1
MSSLPSPLSLSSLSPQWPDLAVPLEVCAAVRGAKNLQDEWTLQGIKHWAWLLSLSLLFSSSLLASPGNL